MYQESEEKYSEKEEQASEKRQKGEERSRKWRNDWQWQAVEKEKWMERERVRLREVDEGQKGKA